MRQIVTSDKRPGSVTAGELIETATNQHFVNVNWPAVKTSR